MRLLNSIPPNTAEPFQAEAFVRRARHLRATMSDKPAELHQALRRSPVDRPVAALAPGEVFAQAVVNEMTGGLLRYSARAALLQRAAGMGIDRFEANLIIAAVQHRLTEHRQSAAHARPKPHWSIPSTGILAIVAVQAAILLAAWLMFS